MKVRVENVKTYKRNPSEKAVYIGRDGPYGNQFIIGRDGNREEVCDKFDEFLEDNPLLVLDLAEQEPDVILCHCVPLRCHGHSYISKMKKWKLI